MQEPAPIEEPIDKDAFARKVLFHAEESRISQDGKAYYVAEPKDRLGFLRLYAEVKGFVGKDSQVQTNMFVKEMKIKLVKPEEKTEIKTVNQVSETPNGNGVNLKLKLVS